MLRRSLDPSRRLARLAFIAVAAVVVALPGCGSGVEDKKTFTAADQPPEITEANTNMENFMKSEAAQPKKGAP